ncbi:threonine synthase [Tepidimicrobium xylanilyticum]|uniref:Threonine synthase n=1 Tax=Tepidimicrobium xylanilyticum TaxID=1123352 RepID=A0A1H3ANM5_9FIRM|nr:threonine synthase [Tepidimicrobium xylanilyticum]SDX31213.1 threonine synthase [Tepidimicrobium xylanilyticum]
MRYFSTRDKTISISSSEAIIQGISKDGGLFVPETIPKIDNLMELTKMDYRKLAYFIMSKFFTDFEPTLLKEAIKDAYGQKFSLKDIVSIEKVQDRYLLELFHGPTYAFKDMALSILPRLLRIALKINDIDKEIVILTATSGDTGKAALEGFANVEGIKIVVFFPEKGVSQIQKLQMITQEGENTFVVGIDGNFDEAQNGVKRIFNDREFKEVLDKYGYILSSANSINIGRLVPQIVYYFYGYLDLLKQGELEDGEKINIVVPTGNFGNILAAYYGKKMGLPVNKLICASNENNVLTDFINTGVYDRRRELKLTSSPSMDILISSNLERLLFYILNEDDIAVKDKMERLNKNGFYKIKNINIEDFYGDYSTEDEVTKTIKDVFVHYNYLMDPHTAVAYNVYDKYKLKTKDNTKTIIASTASPFKFGKKIADSIGLNTLGKDEFQILRKLGDKTEIKIPEGISSLKDKAIKHNNYCSKKEMKSMLKKFLKVGEIYD